MVGVIFISFYFNFWEHPATSMNYTWIMSLLQGHVAEFGSVIEVFLQQISVVYFCPVMCPDQRKQPNYYPWA